MRITIETALPSAEHREMVKTWQAADGDVYITVADTGSDRLNQMLALKALESHLEST